MATGLINEELRVSSSTDHDALVVTIVRAILDQQRPYIRSLGPSACYVAFRAAVGAAERLKRHNLILTIRPGEAVAIGRQNDKMIAQLMYLDVVPG